MRVPSIRLCIALAILTGAASPSALAKLPDPTPEQAQAATIKKQQAAAQAEKEKQSLANSMERIANRWRSRASASGWETHPPTPVAAVPGISASATQQSPSGQPGGQLGTAAAQAPVRSEKAGTAPASEDAKNPAEKGK